MIVCATTPGSFSTPCYIFTRKHIPRHMHIYVYINTYVDVPTYREQETRKEASKSNQTRANIYRIVVLCGKGSSGHPFYNSGGSYSHVHITHMRAWLSSTHIRIQTLCICVTMYVDVEVIARGFSLLIPAPCLSPRKNFPFSQFFFFLVGCRSYCFSQSLLLYFILFIFLFFIFYFLSSSPHLTASLLSSPRFFLLYKEHVPRPGFSSVRIRKTRAPDWFLAGCAD